MKIVVAMNAFKGSLSAREASFIVARGFKEGFREAEVTVAPQADGGDGTLDVLAAASGGDIVNHPVTGPMGTQVVARLLLLGGGRTAVIESAQACGLALVPPGERDVFRAHTRGVGELILHAADLGVQRILIGVGGTATNDGGIGAIQALGGRVMAGDGSDVGPGAEGLLSVHRVSLGSIPDRLSGIAVTVMADVSNPLLGPRGATHVYGPQKGVGPERLSQIEGAMSRYAGVLLRDLGNDPSDEPMAGAGGGLAAALWAFLGAKLEPGSSLVMAATGLLDHLADADLLITGEGAVDSQTARGKVPWAVAEAASRFGVPTVVLGGGLSPDVIAKLPSEYEAAFSTTPRPMPLQEALFGAADHLFFAARQIAALGKVFRLARPDRQDLSAGGVVVRDDGASLQALLIEDRVGMIGIPKGHPEPMESLEDAALRETWEETGIRASIIGDLGEVSYRFLASDDHVVKKTLRVFLMAEEGGKEAPQPGETRRVVWATWDELLEMRRYKDTDIVVARAFGMYQRRQDSTENQGPP